LVTSEVIVDELDEFTKVEPLLLLPLPVEVECDCLFCCCVKLLTTGPSLPTVPLNVCCNAVVEEVSAL
jgi:hypothetical protein